MSDCAGQIPKCLSDLGGVGSDVANQNLLMILGAPGEHGCYDRGANTASNIAHEIDHARDGVPLLCRDTDITSHRYGNEEKPNTNDLRYAQPHREPKTNEQVGSVGRIIQADG